MAAVGRKRKASFLDGNLPSEKRRRTQLSQVAPPNPEFAWIRPKDAATYSPPSRDEQARDALRRSITLALQHVGFDSATDEALESFTLLTETYLDSLSEDITRAANAARRVHANPTDFETSLWRHNLSTPQLKPHIKCAIPKRKLQPQYYDPLEGHVIDPEIPILGPELSGKADKVARKHIPAAFPAFPSTHTYHYTPVDVEAVTVVGTGLRFDNGEPVGGRGILVPDGPRGDPQKMREQAAQDAIDNQRSLGKLMAAGKNNQIKEISQAAERNLHNKERHAAWADCMKMAVDTSDSVQSKGKAVAGLSSTREDIAEYCMLANAQGRSNRTEAHVGAKRRTLRT